MGDRLKAGSYTVRIKRGRVTEATLTGIYLGSWHEVRGVLLSWVEENNRTRWLADYRAEVRDGRKGVGSVGAAGE